MTCQAPADDVITFMIGEPGGGADVKRRLLRCLNDEASPVLSNVIYIVLRIRLHCSTAIQ